MITIGAYIESLLDGSGRFRTLRELHPETDHNGLPLFSVSGDTVRFSVMHEGRTKSLRCPLTADRKHFMAADIDRILNITNKNNPYMAPCEVRKGEMLVFDTAAAPRWNDIMLCDRPDGVPFPAFLRANLNRSDRKPLRELLRNIVAMAESLAADNISHGNLKPENIYVTPDTKPCAVDFAAGGSHSPAGDDMALGLLALNIFLLGCDPGLYPLLGGMEMFRPVRFRTNERHIRAQAEFIRLRPVTDLTGLLVDMNAAASPIIGRDFAAGRKELCNILSRLSVTPFEPMSLLLGLSSAIVTHEVPVIESTASTGHNGAANHLEDISVLVDFRRCETVCDISDTLVRFRLGGKWGFADRYGRRLPTDEFLSAEDFYEGRAKVETASGCGMIDRAGEYVMPPVYEMLEWHGEENIVTACREGKWEVYDRSGRPLTSGDYDWAGGVAEEVLIVRRGNKFGFITFAGIPVTDIRYDEAYSFRNGNALVTNGNDSYRIDKTGRRV